MPKFIEVKMYDTYGQSLSKYVPDLTLEYIAENGLQEFNNVIRDDAVVDDEVQDGNFRMGSYFLESNLVVHVIIREQLSIYNSSATEWGVFIQNILNVAISEQVSHVKLYTHNRHHPIDSVLTIGRRLDTLLRQLAPLKSVILI
ncbi:MAG: hypothetical protein MUO31_07065 [Thermodesulfovibrionales bacterium]|nr:hypothetical protein [Thermodesulfovibrionales bacterium]